jgi:hypothetical protein
MTNEIPNSDMLVIEMRVPVISIQGRTISSGGMRALL